MRPHELQQARALLGMTQKELGEWLGLDTKYPRRSVHNWESGRTPISGPVAKAITLEIAARHMRGEMEVLIESANVASSEGGPVAKRQPLSLLNKVRRADRKGTSSVIRVDQVAELRAILELHDDRMRRLAKEPKRIVRPRHAPFWLDR